MKKIELVQSSFFVRIYTKLLTIDSLPIRAIITPQKE